MLLHNEQCWSCLQIILLANIDTGISAKTSRVQKHKPRVLGLGSWTATHTAFALGVDSCKHNGVGACCETPWTE